MNQADDILFAKINAIPLIDKEKSTKEILSIPDHFSFWDDYRNTKMIPLMTKGARTGNEGSSNHGKDDFAWTSYTPQIIIDWFESYVFPWIETKARIMALITEPNIANYEHIDCDRHELNTRQHKFRIVLQGKTNTLYWITDKGIVYAPDVEEAFIMDGGWPHGMINTGSVPKVTLALGAPWNGKDNYVTDITILQKRKDFCMPKTTDMYWKKEK